MPPPESHLLITSRGFLGACESQIKPENGSAQVITRYSKRRRSRRKFEFTYAGAPEGSVRGENAALLTPPACSGLVPLDISRRK